MEIWQVSSINQPSKKYQHVHSLSKVWYRAAALYFKISNIEKIESKVKSWIYKDIFMKPGQEILYRNTENGSLGLTSILL